MVYQIINSTSKFDAAILAAGDFPSNDTTLNILRMVKPLLVCDNALLGLLKYSGRTDCAGQTKIAPSAIVGDGDSLPEELKKEYHDIYHQYSEQEFNDLTKTTKYALANYPGIHRIVYFGTTGKREDHTIGNLALMVYYFREFGIEPCFITDYGWFSVARGENEFQSFSRQQVSVFNVDCRRLDSSGLKWSCYPFTELWQGTLNEAEGERFTLDGDGTYVVFQTFEAK